MLLLKPIYFTKFHSSRVLNWELKEAMINKFEDIKKELGPMKMYMMFLNLAHTLEMCLLLWDKANIHLIPPFTKWSQLQTLEFGSIAIRDVLCMLVQFK